MNKFILRMLLFFSIIGSLQASHHSTDNDLIPDFAFRFQPWQLTQNSAVLFMGEIGRRNFRANGTLGFLMGENDRFKATGEYLQQKLGYRFSTGTTHEWVRQYAFGVGYQHDFCNSFFSSLDVNGYCSYAPNRRLSDASGLDDGDTFVIERRIAGSSASGISVGSTVFPWKCASLSFDLDYDFVFYQRKFERKKRVHGVGASIYFSQLLTRSLMLNALAELRRPFNYYRASINWAPPNLRNLVVGVFASYTEGRDHLPNNTIVGVEVDFSFLTPRGFARGCLQDECCNTPCASACSALLNCWVSTPAVYLPEVLAIAEERFVCARGPALIAPIPDVAISAAGLYTINTAPFFANVEGAVFTATGLPPASTIDPDTGVITGINVSLVTPFVITVTATTPCGSASGTFTLTFVTCPGGPPTSVTVPNFSTSVPGIYSYDVSSFFTNPVGATPLVFTALGLPLGSVIDPVTGVISGINLEDGSVSVVTVSATNSCGTTSETFTISLLCPGPPTSVTIPDLSTCTPGPIVYDVSPFFTNAPGADPLVFSATGLPAGFAIDPVTGVITGTNPNDLIPHIVTVTATNECGFTSQTFTMTFPCPVPTSTTIPDLVDPSLGGEPYVYDVSSFFTSPCGQTITFSATGLPPGSSINPATGVISGTTNGTQLWTVTVTATTICGETQQTFTMDFSSQ